MAITNDLSGSWDSILHTPREATTLNIDSIGIGINSPGTKLSATTTLGAVGSNSLSSTGPLPSISVNAYPWPGPQPQQESISIRGEMLTVQLFINQSLLEDKLIDKDKIKHDLALQIAHKLLEGKYIEFTQRTDFATYNKIIAARLFVTPDSQTQLIRKNQEK